MKDLKKIFELASLNQPIPDDIKESIGKLDERYATITSPSNNIVSSKTITNEATGFDGLRRKQAVDKLSLDFINTLIANQLVTDTRKADLFKKIASLVLDM